MLEIVYNPMSQVTQLKTGAATGNADIEQYSYDNQTGLLNNQKVIKQNSNQTLLDLSYEYNRGQSNGSQNGKTGNLTHIVNNLDRNKDRVYEYDALGRLKTAKGGAATGIGGVAANWTQNYSYDGYANRISVQASGNTANNQAVPSDGISNLSYDQASNRINTAGYQYDLAGNLTRGQKADGSWERYEYDAAGRMTTVKDDAGNQKQGNGYTSSRQRLIRNEQGVGLTWYVWGGSQVISEYTSQGWNAPMSWTKSYIYAGSRLLTTYTKNTGGGETQEFHHPDRLGTKLITNNQANTSFEQSTLPFGTSLDAETTGATNQRFTSYDRSTVAGLDYAVNRSYSSGQGRFTQVDPIGINASSAGNPQSLNLYAYVENNPIDFIDPSGLNLRAVQVCRYELVTFWVDGQFDSAEMQQVCETRYVVDNGGGGNPAPGNSGSEKPDYERIRKETTDCINSLWQTDFRTFNVDSFDFAISGVKNGSTLITITRNDRSQTTFIISADATSQTGSQLLERYTNDNDKKDDRGGYLPGYTSYSTTNQSNTSIANDLDKHPRAGMETGLEKIMPFTHAVQIHELGVALSTFLGTVDPPKNPKTGKAYGDDDTGMTLEDCVYKRLTKKSK